MVKLPARRRAGEGQVFRVRKGAKRAHHPAQPPAHIIGRADMAGAAGLRPIILHAHLRAGGEARRSSFRRSTHAKSSCRITPFSTMSAAMERSQRS